MARPTVLVTGAAGFVGGWVTEALCARELDVRAGVPRTSLQECIDTSVLWARSQD
jgi:nucleoside-diphosphate-sugar epimerase